MAGEAHTEGLAKADQEALISVRDLVVGFGDRVILNGLDLDIVRGAAMFSAPPQAASQQAELVR